MNRWPMQVRTVLLIVLGCIALSGMFGACSMASGEGESSNLRPGDVRAALRGLPFAHELVAVRPPKNDTGAFRGMAHGRFSTTLHFSIGLGSEPWAVPVPGAGTRHATYDEVAGFAFNDDTALGSRFKSVAQWHEASRMAVTMEEVLCRRATGKSCPPWLMWRGRDIYEGLSDSSRQGSPRRLAVFLWSCRRYE
jgi:hypothetical protein